MAAAAKFWVSANVANDDLTATVLRLWHGGRQMGGEDKQGLSHHK